MTELLTLSLFFLQLSDTGGVFVGSVSSAPEPFTSTPGWPKSSLSVLTTLGTWTRTASLNNYVIRFTLLGLWI